VRPPSKQLRRVYLASGESDYRIAQSTGVHRETLRRFREGKAISMRAFDRLAIYWELELRKRKWKSR